MTPHIGQRLIIPPGLIVGQILARHQVLRPKEIPRGILVIGKDGQGRERWSGRFRSSADAEEFIHASVTGELWFDRDLWHLPSPQWHPDYGPLIYEFALSLDGHNASQNGAGGTTITSTLTTTSGSDVIVVYVVVRTAAPSTITSVTGAGINFNASARKQLTFATNDDFELWYGTANGALSNVTITANNSASISTDACMAVFGISGANTASISDSNASLPAFNTGTGSVPTVTGISTSNKNDMIIAGEGNATNVANTVGAGFTLIDAIAPNLCAIADEYKIVTATQSSVSAAFGTSVTNWAMIVDAVKAGGGHRLPLLGIGPATILTLPAVKLRRRQLLGFLTTGWIH